MDKRPQRNKLILNFISGKYDLPLIFFNFEKKHLKKYLYIFFFLILSCSKKENLEAKNSFYDKAFNYREKNKYDSAFLYFDKARDLFLKQKDSFGAGKCLINMAIIQEQFADNFGSQETSLQALRYFDENNLTHFDYLKSNYNNLGITSYNIKNYDDAVKFYDSAIKFAGDTKEEKVYLNNKANAYRELKEYNKALSIYDSLIKNKPSDDHKNLARLLTNRARTKWLQNFKYNPVPEYITALTIRNNENDFFGQISSHSHLADYYKNLDPSKALLHSQNMYSISRKLNNPDDQIEALQKLILLENSEISKKYFEVYKNLNDSLNSTRSIAKNQFAVIRYGVEKLKAENAEKEFGVLQRNIGIGALSFLLIGGIFYYRKRKQRMQLESENKLKEQQLKTSKKVHDIVANGIYQVMTKIENQDSFNKEQALDELEFVYEKSRDISYEKPDAPNQNFKEKISNLIASFKNEKVNTFIAGNDEQLWETVSESTQTEIYQVIRELLVNMKKHSKASNVAFRFEKINNSINIYYTDNGIGISDELIFKNGLSNTVSRIDNINGKITFDTKTEKGLKINISFPAS